jgi:hypothetical protein
MTWPDAAAIVGAAFAFAWLWRGVTGADVKVYQCDCHDNESDETEENNDSQS